MGRLYVPEHDELNHVGVQNDHGRTRKRIHETYRMPGYG